MDSILGNVIYSGFSTVTSLMSNLGSLLTPVYGSRRDRSDSEIPNNSNVEEEDEDEVELSSISDPDTVHQYLSRYIVRNTETIGKLGDDCAEKVVTYKYTLPPLIAFLPVDNDSTNHVAPISYRTFLADRELVATRQCTDECRHRAHYELFNWDEIVVRMASSESMFKLDRIYEEYYNLKYGSALFYHADRGADFTVPNGVKSELPLGDMDVRQLCAFVEMCITSRARSDLLEYCLEALDRIGLSFQDATSEQLRTWGVYAMRLAHCLPLASQSKGDQLLDALTNTLRRAPWRLNPALRMATFTCLRLDEHPHHHIERLTDETRTRDYPDLHLHDVILFNDATRGLFINCVDHTGDGGGGGRVCTKQGPLGAYFFAPSPRDVPKNECDACHPIYASANLNRLRGTCIMHTLPELIECLSVGGGESVQHEYYLLKCCLYGGVHERHELTPKQLLRLAHAVRKMERGDTQSDFEAHLRSHTSHVDMGRYFDQVGDKADGDPLPRFGGGARKTLARLREIEQVLLGRGGRTKRKNRERDVDVHDVPKKRTKL